MKEYAEMKQEEKKRRKRSKDKEIDINNLALTLFMLINIINLRRFYTDVKALKKSLLCCQLQEDNAML
jgi:hypothetical protein